MQEIVLYRHSAILAPRSKWGKFLKYRQQYPSADFILFDLPSLEAHFGATFASNALGYLLLQGHSYQEASNILRDIRFLKSNKTYHSPEVQKLSAVLKGLEEAGLVKRTFHPEYDFQGRDIIISGYGSGERISTMLKDLPNISVSYDLDTGVNEPLPPLYCFAKAISAFHFLGNKLSEALANGAKPEELVILNYSKELRFYLEQMAAYYHLPLALPSSTRLSSTKEGKDILSKFKDSDIEVGEILKEAPEEIAKALAPLNYPKLTGAQAYYAARELLSLTTVSTPKLTGAIEASSAVMPSFGKKGYFLDFSLNHAPKTVGDDPLLPSDSLLSEAGLSPVEQRLRQNEADLTIALRSGSIEFALYFETGPSSRYPSPLIKKLGIKEIKEPLLDYEYSEQFGQNEAAFAEENAQKYKIFSPRGDSLKSRFPIQIHYSHKYQASPYDYRPDHTSYSAISTWIDCPFSYYCSYVLGLKSDTNFGMLRGTAAHAYLEHYPDLVQANSAFEAEVAASPYKVNDSERLILTHVKEDAARYADLFFSLPIGEVEHEKVFNRPLFAGIDLTGKVDLLAKKDGFYYVFDFKSSQKQNFVYERLQFGVNLQLPIYAYLTAGQVEGYELAGLFIAPFAYKNKTGAAVDPDEDYSYLSGVYPSLGEMPAFDPDGLLTRKDRGGNVGIEQGAYGPEQFAELAHIAGQHIDKALNRILGHGFPILPRKIVNESFNAQVNPCEKCSFASICHHHDEDEVVYIEHKKKNEPRTYTLVDAAIAKEEAEEDDNDESEC